MAKDNCEATLRQNDDGTTDLVIVVPFDSDKLADIVALSPGTKKSCTLVQADIVAEKGGRGNIPLYAQIGHNRVLVNGGVNLWCSRPADVGIAKVNQGSTTAVRDVRKLSDEIDAAKAARALTMTICHKPLLDPQGKIFRKEGEEILTETLGTLLIAGFTWMPEPAKPLVVDGKKRPSQGELDATAAQSAASEATNKAALAKK